MNRCLAACSLSSTLVFFCSVPAAEPSETIVIHAGVLLAVPGEPPRQRQSIIIRAGRVEEIRDGFVPASATGDNDAEIIDLSDQFVMPGFIDLHVHLSGGADSNGKLSAVTMGDADVALTAAMHARRTRMAGFTTVRDLGSRGNALFALRDAIKAGKVPAPRYWCRRNPSRQLAVTETFTALGKMCSACWRRPGSAMAPMAAGRPCVVRSSAAPMSSKSPRPVGG